MSQSSLGSLKFRPACRSFVVFARPPGSLHAFKCSASAAPWSAGATCRGEEFGTLGVFLRTGLCDQGVYPTVISSDAWISKKVWFGFLGKLSNSWKKGYHWATGPMPRLTQHEKITRDAMFHSFCPRNTHTDRLHAATLRKGNIL